MCNNVNKRTESSLGLMQVLSPLFLSTRTKHEGRGEDTTRAGVTYLLSDDY